VVDHLPQVADHLPLAVAHLPSLHTADVVSSSRVMDLTAFSAALAASVMVTGLLEDTVTMDTVASGSTDSLSVAVIHMVDLLLVSLCPVCGLVALDLITLCTGPECLKAKRARKTPRHLLAKSSPITCGMLCHGLVSAGAGLIQHTVTQGGADMTVSDTTQDGIYLSDTGTGENRTFRRSQRKRKQTSLIKNRVIIGCYPS